MTNSTLVSPVKKEYATKNNIFGLKMTVKSGLEKNILKFLRAQSLFWKIFFSSSVFNVHIKKPHNPNSFKWLVLFLDLYTVNYISKL